jgi:enoyl-CoA hydratase/carnithine racemase
MRWTEAEEEEERRRKKKEEEAEAEEEEEMAQKKTKTRTWRSLQVQGADDDGDGDGVAKLTLHRPLRSNAFDSSLFAELPLAIAHLDSLPAVRAIVLAGSGKNFCSGIDLSLLLSPNVSPDSGLNHGGDGRARKDAPAEEEDGARDRERTLRFIKDLQDSFSSIEACRKPVIAAVHGACVGAGVDLIAACDLRLEPSFFAEL